MINGVKIKVLAKMKMSYSKLCLNNRPHIFIHHPHLLAPIFTGSLTLVPLSLLLNRTETLATQATTPQQ